MAYNYPYQAPYYPNYQYQPQQNSGITWVQGEAGAKSYLVAPNTTVQLWDSEAQRIYLKARMHQACRASRSSIIRSRAAQA